MDLRQIESFFWIATLGSFSAAAKRLFITQSAISSRILLLESELGAALFDRGGRRPKLTPRGLELFGDAQRLLELAARMRENAVGGSRLHGTVRLGVVNTIAHTWLPRLVKELDRRYPKIDVDLQVGVSAALDGMLRSRDLDLMIATTRGSGPGMMSALLCRYPVAWVTATSLALAKEPIPLSEIGRHRVMTYERGTVLHRVISELFRRHGIWPLRLIGSNSVAALLELAADGVGICAIPAPVAAPLVGAGRLRLLRTEAALPDAEFFVTHRREPANALAAAVADAALDLCGDPVIQHPPMPRRQRSSGRNGR